MIASLGISISTLDCHGRRDDSSFISDLEWSNAEHVRAAVQLWLASRLAAASGGSSPVQGARDSSLGDQELAQIRMRLACNPKSPAAVLAYIAHTSQGSKAVERVAENPNASPELLIELAHHADGDVRAAVADNPNVTSELFEILMADENPDVRYRLAENPNLPMQLLTRLCADDSNPYVAARASATLARLSCGRVFRADFEIRGRSKVVAIR